MLLSISSSTSRTLRRLQQSTLQGDKTPTTDDAVIIIGISDGRERVFTTYPGTITPRGTGKTDEFKGQTMSISSFREEFGEDVYVNIKLGQPLAEMPTEV